MSAAKKSRLYVVPMPSGCIARRRSPKVFTHVWRVRAIGNDDEIDIVGFASSEALARRAMSKAERWCIGREGRTVDIVEIKPEHIS